MNALLGLFLHAVGGLSAGSFYVPLKKVRNWSWESSWFVMGIAAWIIGPILVARLTVPNFTLAIAQADASVLWQTFLLGALWGIGGLTFGLAMRYLGMGLGYAVTLGLCAVFGTLIPPIFNGTFIEAFSSQSGLIIAIGLAVCLFGIGLSGYAGKLREKEEAKKKSARIDTEFDPKKGYIVAIVSGLLSACMAFAITAGQPIADLVLELIPANADLDSVSLFRNNAVLCVVLAGGFSTNAVWCIWLMLKNKSAGDLTKSSGYQARNYTLSAISGLIWYGQFFFYGMGTTKLGEQYEFSSWTLHMAFIVIFSTLWSLMLKEWNGVSSKPKRFVLSGVAVLIFSTIIIGYGNYLSA